MVYLKDWLLSCRRHTDNAEAILASDRHSSLNALWHISLLDKLPRFGFHFALKIGTSTCLIASVKDFARQKPTLHTEATPG